MKKLSVAKILILILILLLSTNQVAFAVVQRCTDHICAGNGNVLYAQGHNGGHELDFICNCSATDRNLTPVMYCWACKETRHSATNENGWHDYICQTCGKRAGTGGAHNMLNACPDCGEPGLSCSVCGHTVVHKCAPNDSTSVAVPPTLTSVTVEYDGQPHTVVVSGGSGGTIYYNTTGTNNDWSLELPTRTNVGTTTVYAFVRGDSTHDDSEIVNATIIITKGVISPTIAFPGYTYGGTLSNPTISGNSGAGAVTYYYRATGSSTWKNWNEVTSSTFLAAGTYQMYASVAATANYLAGDTPVITFVVERAAASPVISMADYVYGGIMSTPTLTSGNPGNATVTFYYNTTNSNVDGMLWSTVTNSKSLNAGTYYMYCIVDSSTNYNSATSSTVTFHITKAPRTMAYLAEPVLKVEDYRYESEPMVPTVTRNLEDGQVLYYYYKSGDTIDDSIAWVNITGTSLNSGEYFMYATVGETTNYQQGTTDPESFKVTPHTAQLPTITNYVGEYDGQEHTLTVGNNVHGGTTYFSDDDEHWTTTPPSYSNIGEYHILIKVIGDRNHYDSELVNGTVTITGKDITGNGMNVTLGTTTYNYDGTEKQPSVTVTSGTTTLVRDTDYTVTYIDNIHAGTATAVIEGINNYNGTVSKQFVINPITLTVTAQSISVPFGDEIPGIDFAFSGQASSDVPSLIGEYQTLATSSSPVGEYDINQGTLALNPEVVTPSDYNLNYVKGTITITPKLISADDMTCSISPIAFEYNGKAQKVNISLNRITGSDTPMVEGEDFQAVYSNNVNVGTATVTITGIGNFGGTITKEFSITKRTLTVLPDSLSKNYGTNDPTLTYTYSNNAEGEVPGFTGALSRVAGENVGTYQVLRNTLNISNNAPFLVSNYNLDFIEGVVFTINSATADRFQASLSPTEFYYDGNAHLPTVTVKDRITGATLVRGLDYSLNYKDNINVGTATVTVTGINDYRGSVDLNFQIKQVQITGNVRIEANTSEPCVSDILSARVTVNPTRDVKLSYQWYVSDTDGVTGGTPITGANMNRLVLTEDMVNKYIYVSVLAEKPNHISATFTAKLGVKVKERTAPTAPVITAKLNSSAGADYTSGAWTNQNVWINLKSEENYVIDRYEYSTESQNSGFRTITTFENNQASLLLTQNTNRVTYYFRCVDFYGNISSISSIVIAIDKVAPNIYSVTKDIESWTNNRVRVTSHVTDDMSGVSGYFFAATNTNTYQAIDPELDTTISEVYDNNVNDYYFGIRDQAGNTAYTTFTIDNIDKIAPKLIVNPTKNESTIDLDITVGDYESGVDGLTINGINIDVNPSGVDYVGNYTITDGDVYNVIVKDIAGNETAYSLTVYAVRYSTNGVLGNIATQLKYPGESVIVKECTLTSEEYEFVNWNTSPDGTSVDYNPGDTYSLDESVTLYAQWNKIDYLLDRIVLDSYEIPYTGYEIIPSEKVYNNFGQLLQRDEDYRITFENNIEVGNATVLVEGIKKYAGQSLNTSFRIYGIDIGGANLTIDPTTYVYDGYAKKPTPTVTYGIDTLVKGKDYIVSYENNINAGTATLTVTGRGSYYGAKSIEYTIAKAARNVKAYNVGLIKGERVELQYSYEDEKVNDTLVSADTSIARIETTSSKYYLTAIDTGYTTLTYSIPEDTNYVAETRTLQVTVFENKETAKPIYGSVIIDNNDEKTVTPRTLLEMRASCADYMYISTSNTAPSVDSDGWYDYSTKMPFVFDDAEGIKNIYVWFKDDNGNISDMATDHIELDYDYEYPAHDQIMLDKTEIDLSQPNVEFIRLLPSGITMDVIFTQKDVMVNGTRSGVDYGTIKYGYKKKSDTGNYTWSDNNRFTGLDFSTSYVVVTQAKDRAGNGPTISDEYEFVTPTKYTTVITLHDTNAPCDGLVHEIDPAEFEIYGENQPTGTITYTYYTDRECTRMTTPDSDGSIYVGGPPSRGATYYVKVTLTDDPAYHNAISNMARLRIGWYLDKEDDWSQNVFSYVEETETDSGKYELTVIGDGKMKDMEELIARDPDPKLSYWVEYVDDITILTLGDDESNLQNIGSEVFAGLTGISEINIPKTVVEIGDRAFAGDNGVTNVIVIPGTTKKIGVNPFADVKTPEFQVLYGDSGYDAIDGVLVSRDHSELIAYPAGNTASQYVVPEEVKYIKTSAFEGSDNLENVIIHETVKSIGSKAFYDCDNLEQIEIFDLKDDDVKDLTDIGDDAFMKIADASEIYTFSKTIADMIISERDYDPDKTTVYWPPVVTLQPMDMFGGVGQTVKFIIEAEKGYLGDLHYEWHKQTEEKIRPGLDPLATGGTTNSPTEYTSEYTTPALTLSNDGDKYYCVVWNMPYYQERGYAHSESGMITMLGNANYRVERVIPERNTTNNYLFERLQEAFEFAQSDDNIRVMKDVYDEPDATLTDNKKITFTNDGKTINMTGKININGGSSIEMKGAGAIAKSDNDFVIDNRGDLTLNHANLSIKNTAGTGIKLTNNATLSIIQGAIETSKTAINATNSTISMTSGNAKVLVNSGSNVNAIELNNYTKFDMSNGVVEAKATSTSVDSIAAIYNNGKDDVNEGKGRITISGGSIKATGNGVANGVGIVNVNSSDVVMTGGSVEGTRAGIENTRTNKFGDLTIAKGQVVGGFIGIINNADSAKVIFGVKDKSVTDAEPRISGGKAAIINASRYDTMEFYDGTLSTGRTYNSASNSVIIYEGMNNTSLAINPSIEDMVYQENGREDIITEEDYSIYTRVESGRNVATLSQSKTPIPSHVDDATVEEGEQATFEVVIETPGHPDVYEYEWEVSIDNGATWSKVTTGVGINTSKYTTPPASLGMNNNMYRCKITNRAGTIYTNTARLFVIDDSLYKDQKPYVRVIYKNEEKLVNYENESDTNSTKYVNMEVIIKSFAELDTAKFSYDGQEVELLDIGTETMENVYYIHENSRITIQRTRDIYEYTYSWDVKAYKNGLMTVRAVDVQNRDHTDSHTIDAIFDLKINYEKSSLSDVNNRLVITFYANKPVSPYNSITDGSASTYWRDLRSSNGLTYSYKFTLTPNSAMGATRYYFEDEFNNKTYIDVEELVRIAYKDIRFTNEASLQDINDMTVVEAYNVAQKLENETEINDSFGAQSRYGISQVQADMFMARARDIGAAEMLSSAKSSMSYDGFYIKETDVSLPSADEYKYGDSIRNNYIAAVIGDTNELISEKPNYVDTISNPNLYKGADISNFRMDDTEPYMYEDQAGRAVNIKNEIKDASFRAVIVSN